METEFLARGFKFLDGLRWHGGYLYASDIFAGYVYRITPEGLVEELFEVPGAPSGLGFLPDGDLLVVSMNDKKLLRKNRDSNELRVVAELEGLVGGAANDMLLHPAGQAYIGNFGFDLYGGESARPTALLMLTPEGLNATAATAAGEAKVVADNLVFPNGIAVSGDGKTLVVAESFALKLTAFDILADGSLENRRTFAQFEKEVPDGICMDTAGGVWVATFDVGDFIRVKEGGEITHRIKAGKRAVSCAMGGEDKKTLFMSLSESSPEQLNQGISEGVIVTAPVDVPGV